MTKFLLVATDTDTGENVYARAHFHRIQWAAGMRINGSWGKDQGPYPIQAATRFDAVEAVAALVKLTEQHNSRPASNRWIEDIRLIVAPE